MATFTPQNAVISVEFPIHDTHCMKYEPCLYLECNKCGTTSKDPKELARWCNEELVLP